MLHYREFILFAFMLAHVDSIRMTKRGDLTGCHPMLDFNHLVQFWKLNGSEQDVFLEGLGCEVRSNLAESANFTCEESSFACASNVPNGTNYMCCKVKYLSRGGPKITTMLGESVNLWQSGVSTLLQIPKAPEVPPTLLVQINVQPYAPYWYTMGCEEGRISEVFLSGSSLGVSNLTIRSGALHGDASFAVRVGEEPWQELSWRSSVVDKETILVSSPGVTVTGVISAKDPKHWGPDASATVTVGGLSIEVQQQTLGTGDESKTMLDVSVRGTFSKSAGVGGLLGPDGVTLLQGVEPVPCMTVDLPVSS